VRIQNILHIVNVTKSRIPITRNNVGKYEEPTKQKDWEYLQELSENSNSTLNNMTR